MLLPTKPSARKIGGTDEPLFHGTDGGIVRAVIQSGLICRNQTGRNNYAAVEGGTLTSHSDYVYLTTRNYLSHALNTAIAEGIRTQKYLPAMVVKVPLQNLDPNDLYPDEDYLRDEARSHKLPEARWSVEDLRAVARDAIESHQAFWVNSLFEYDHHVVAYKSVVPTTALSAVSLIHLDAILTDCFRVPRQHDGTGGLQFRKFTNVSDQLAEQVEQALLDYVWGEPISGDNAAAILEYRDLNLSEHRGASEWVDNLDKMKTEAAYVFDPNDEDKTRQEQCLSEFGL